MMIFDIDACEEKIGYKFKDKMLLRQCFTHASYANEHKEKNNELLEFFGDAVIQFVVTEYLYQKHGGDEGKLTTKRAKIVSKEPLLKSVFKLGLNEFILLGRGQEKNFNNDEKLFSSVYEALVAGIYFDGGMAQVKRFIRRTIIKDFEENQRSVKTGSVSDVKNKLQEYVQGKKLGVLKYETIAQTGPDHCPEFHVAVTLNGVELARAKGTSKKNASTAVAEKAIKLLLKQEGKKH